MTHKQLESGLIVLCVLALSAIVLDPDHMWLSVVIDIFLSSGLWVVYQLFRLRMDDYE